MYIDIKIRSVGELRELLRELKHLFRCHPHRHGRVNFVVGNTLKEVEDMSIVSLNMNPGQTRWISVEFTDNAIPPVSHPLSELPTAVDASGVLTLTAVGAGGAAPTPTDPKFFWKVDCAAGQAPATGVITATGKNPDGVVDTRDLPYTVNALDDTVVDFEVLDVAP
jgi:hypothetical protein